MSLTTILPGQNQNAAMSALGLAYGSSDEEEDVVEEQQPSNVSMAAVDAYEEKFG